MGQRFFLVALLALFAAGCQRSSPPQAAKPPPAKAPGTIGVERVPEAEKALNQLGHLAWVFKHSGGLLTSEFTISHLKDDQLPKRGGKTQPE